MFRGLLSQSATRLRGVPVEDPYSGETTRVDWSNPDRLDLPRVSVQPVTGNEITFDRATVISRWWLFVEGHPDITPHDRVEYAGESYEVDGEVLRWPGRLAHTQVMLKRTEG